jgi:hypothetical protein
MSRLHYLRKGGPLHVTAALHVTGGSRSWRTGAPSKCATRHTRHMCRMAHPAKKSQKRQALNRETYIESVERALWRSGAPRAMRHMRHPRAQPFQSQ